MFEKIRKPGRAKSILAYIIFFLICLVFVFLGVPIDSLSGAGGLAVVVNREGVPLIEFSKRLDQMQRTSKSSLDAKSQKEQQKKNSQIIINQLINESLLSQKAKEADLAVSDWKVREEITSIEYFQEKGVFKTALYLAFLKNQRSTAKAFEDQMRKWIISSKVEKLFNYAFMVSDLEKQRNQQLSQVQLQLKYVRVSLMDNSSKDVQKWQDLLLDSSRLEKELKKQNLQWIDSKKLSLRNWGQGLPTAVDEKDVFEQVLKVIPSTGLVPKLFVSADGFVIFSLKSFKFQPVQTKAIESMDSFLSLALARMTFSSWLEFVKSQSRIHINPKIL